LADFFYRFGRVKLRRELEEFRSEFEAEFGETDLARRYTSQLPIEQQEWLTKHYPKRYWDGLPPFLQAFYKGKMRLAHREGNIDDAPEDLLELYLKGQMDIRDNGWNR